MDNLRMEHERLKEYGTGCLICGEELFYSEIIAARTCFYCGVIKETNSSCRNGHYICDTCHNETARELGVVLPVEMTTCCSFTDRNRECLRERCGFYGRQSGEPVMGGIVP